ncbi:MAG TPA: hypothetical protein VNW54_09490 [Granulicella sp.]|jgi:hypothetical protein|nr:hypothetical protein [Granulicella sp.]
MVKPLVEILEEWWSVARQNDPQIQPNPKTLKIQNDYCKTKTNPTAAGRVETGADEGI